MTGERRLAFLITGLNHGGAETQLLRLVAELRQRGWSVLLISLMPTGELGKWVTGSGVRLESLGVTQGVHVPRAAWRLVKLLRSWRPLVLTSFLFHANLLGRVAGRVAGVPVVISSERSDRFGGRYRYWLLRATDRLADVTVTNSRLVGERLVRERVIDRGRLRVIPNALDPAISTPITQSSGDLRRSLGIGQDDFLWLAVGRIDSTKDYPILLEAFAQHRLEFPQARLRIAGAGEPTGVLAALPSEQRVETDRIFLGHRDDVRELLAAADGFVMSSNVEGFPNALMEAFACGIPAVGTAVGGIPELIQEGATGALAPPRDPAGLAAAMGRLVSMSPTDRKRLGEAGRGRVLALCGLPRVVDRWEALFTQLLSERMGHPSPPAPALRGEKGRTMAAHSPTSPLARRQGGREHAESE